jgi:hydroxymethylpyrimidine pyrophosphatase-like HAD family hydrolase
VRYLALATDYDGTLAELGTVRPETIAAVERLRKSGRRALLVTGRELGDLKTVFDRFDLFDLVVAENGALLYRPQTREETCVAEPPPPALFERLRQRGVTPLHHGKVIVATREPHEVAALEVVRELGLEWHREHFSRALWAQVRGARLHDDTDAGLPRTHLKSCLRVFALKHSRYPAFGSLGAMPLS